MGLYISSKRTGVACPHTVKALISNKMIVLQHGDKYK